MRSPRLLYLYTSGTLPHYRRLGWRAVEPLAHLQREGTIINYDVGLSAVPSIGMPPTACGRG